MYVTLLNLPEHLFKSLHADMAAAWSGQLIFDIFIFLFTLIRSLRIRKQATRSIADILLRDGAPVELALPLQLTSMNH